MILSAIQQNRTTVRLVTDQGTRYVTGVLQGYTAQTVSVKNNENSTTIRICDAQGHTIKYVQCR